MVKGSGLACRRLNRGADQALDGDQVQVERGGVGDHLAAKFDEGLLGLEQCCQRVAPFAVALVDQRESFLGRGDNLAGELRQSRARMEHLLIDAEEGGAQFEPLSLRSGRDLVAPFTGLAGGAGGLVAHGQGE